MLFMKFFCMCLDIASEIRCSIYIFCTEIVVVGAVIPVPHRTVPTFRVVRCISAVRCSIYIHGDHRGRSTVAVTKIIQIFTKALSNQSTFVIILCTIAVKPNFYKCKCYYKFIVNQSNSIQNKVSIL